MSDAATDDARALPDARGGLDVRDARDAHEEAGESTDVGDTGPSDDVPPNLEVAPTVDVAPDVGVAVDVNVDLGVDVMADVADRGPPSVADSLVARWKFDEGNGIATADASGRGNTGTLRGGVTWRYGRRSDSPHALELDGEDDYVEVTVQTLPAIEAAKTVAFWMFTIDKRETQHNVVSLSNPETKQGIQIGTNANRLAVWQWIDTVGFMELATPLSAAWHHVAYTFSGAEHRLYLDGALVAASAQASHVGKVTSARIGTYSPGREMFRGLLDDVQIYDRTLTAAEIRSLFEM